MAKVTLTDVVNLQNETTAVTAINNNNTLIENAIENTLSRDGTSPNTMGANIDINSYRLINLPAPEQGTEPVRLQDLKAYIDQLDGTSTIAPAAGAGDIDKIVKVAAVGTFGYTDVLVDSSFNIKPKTNDVGALGTTSLKWADLFLASGAVINFNSGDVTITHSADRLTFEGANNGYLFSGSTPTIFLTDTDTSGDCSISANTSNAGLKFTADINNEIAASTIEFAIDGTTSNLILTPTALTPGTDDGQALGTTSLKWGDLFLANGAVINFNSSDVVLTHSAGILTMGTGDLRVTTAGSNSASVVTVGGTQTLTNKTLTTPVINGVTNGSSAAAGVVGELLTASSGLAALTASTDTNATSISLTAGDWDVRGSILYTPAATTSVTRMFGGINTTSATLPTTTPQTNRTDVATAANVMVQPYSVYVGPCRISVASTTTIYLVARATFTVSTMQISGYIEARRVR